MYLLFSPMYLNKNSIFYFAKFNEIIFIGFTVLDRKSASLAGKYLYATSFSRIFWKRASQVSGQSAM